MTLLADVEESEIPWNDPDVSAPQLEASPPSQRRIHRISTALPRVLLGLVVVVVLWAICADPVAHVWYQSRQHGLTNQAASALTHLGSQTPVVGGSVAVLQDPTIGLDVTIAQGDTPSILRGAPGHRPRTPLPGARGNSVVVGHDRDWGAPFKGLSKLTVGSTLYLQAHPGVYKLPDTGDFVYTVRSIATATASDTKFLAPTNDYRLTLITDTGGRLTGNRVLVITAVSGALGKVIGPAPAGSLDSSRGALILNGEVGGIILGAAVVAGAFVVLRRHHRTAITLAVLSPVMASTLIAVFLEFDMVAFRPLA